MYPPSPVNKFKNKSIVSNCKPDISDFFIFTRGNHGYPGDENPVVVEVLCHPELWKVWVALQISMRIHTANIHSV
jgi:hypothetical protein